MSKFAIYDQLTGVIFQTISGTMNLEDVQAVASAGQSVVEVSEDVTDGAHYIDAKAQAQPYPARPSQFHVWQLTQWVDPRTPDEVSAADAVARQQTAQKAIRSIEAGLDRPIREALLAWINGEPPPVNAAAILRDAEQRIEALRVQAGQAFTARARKA